MIYQLGLNLFIIIITFESSQDSRHAHPKVTHDESWTVYTAIIISEIRL